MKKGLGCMFALLLFSIAVDASTLKVDCNKPGPMGKIGTYLKFFNRTGPNTLAVSGNCHENVVIQSFDRLTLIASPAASITDASGGTAPVVDIDDSRTVMLTGFTINGGFDGIDCSNASICYLTKNTVQSSVGQQGVGIGNGSQAFLADNVIQNNGERGLTANEGSQVFSTNDTLQDNAAEGIVINSGVFLEARNSTVRNNGSGGGNGVTAIAHSTLRLISCTITGNALSGVRLQFSSEARFDSSSVSGNGDTGVTVGDLSFAFFGPGSNVIGNLSGTDVLCAPQFSATRGALTNIGGGTTNCIEP